MILEIIGIIVIVPLVILIHEIMHSITANYLGISNHFFIIKDKKWHTIPLGICMQMKGYEEKKMKDLTSDEKYKYFSVAIMPYIFIMPYSIILIQLENYVFSFIGLFILLLHVFNFPLEFYNNYKDVRGEGESVIL